MPISFPTNPQVHHAHSNAEMNVFVENTKVYDILTNDTSEDAKLKLFGKRNLSKIPRSPIPPLKKKGGCVPSPQKSSMNVDDVIANNGKSILSNHQNNPQLISNDIVANNQKSKAIIKSSEVLLSVPLERKVEEKRIIHENDNTIAFVHQVQSNKELSMKEKYDMLKQKHNEKKRSN